MHFSTAWATAWAAHSCIAPLQARARSAEAGNAAAAAAATAEAQLLELRSARDAAAGSRREAWRAEQDAAESAARLGEEQRRRRQLLEGTIARDIARGLQVLEQGVASQPALAAGVHGRLVDLIDCPPQLDLAVEVTAGKVALSSVYLCIWLVYLCICVSGLVFCVSVYLAWSSVYLCIWLGLLGICVSGLVFWVSVYLAWSSVYLCILGGFMACLLSGTSQCGCMPFC